METRPSIRGGVYTWTQAKVGTSGHFIVTSLHKLFVQPNFRMIKHCCNIKSAGATMLYQYSFCWKFKFQVSPCLEHRVRVWVLDSSGENIELSSSAPDAV